MFFVDVHNHYVMFMMHNNYSSIHILIKTNVDIKCNKSEISLMTI